MHSLPGRRSKKADRQKETRFMPEAGFLSQLHLFNKTVTEISKSYVLPNAEYRLGKIETSSGLKAAKVFTGRRGLLPLRASHRLIARTACWAPKIFRLSSEIRLTDSILSS